MPQIGKVTLTFTPEEIGELVRKALVEADDRARYARIIAEAYPAKKSYAHGVSEEEARANRDLIVLAVNSYAAHLALLRRALDACYGDTWQTCNPNHLANWAQEIRAALSGADK